MKLAEALMQRADCQKRIAQLRQRLTRSAKVQEGEQPPENPQELLSDVDAAITELTRLVQRINQTNANTVFAEGSLSDALAQRDTLLTKRSVLENLIQAASITHDRYSRSEVRFVSTVDIGSLQRQLDSISRDYRLLDAQIQSLNWQIDLLGG
ncbi:DIP1984 family protein [Leptothoe sp. ISB3NOV94-8A]|uniref:DIP1984 family protein n=1 Tax=Leptolyngbya sp. Heron Island J TaxID=1385935 RepID=UPI0003B9DA89|nr:DIP1984 family protein [Leptolyngbya sp. Heron Island J]ESA32146.1 septicolysin [Leptolyngbya sp. Heron Island J]